MAVSLADRKRATVGLKSWLDDVATYEREAKKWEGRSDKILKRYRDEFRTGQTGYTTARFNILWSNVQTLTAATYSKVPKPDVSRRFRDNDPVGRVASLILERALDYEISHYPDYRATLKEDVQDRFLGGRGTAWVRYEPHFRAAQMGVPTDGEQITDDVDESGEELDYECTPTDYVHPKDFGHSIARTWEEVTRVWRKVYMTREALVDRFGEEVSKLVPMDATPKDTTSTDGNMRPVDSIPRACVYEGWDKAHKKAVWFSKGVKDFLDERDDPLGLEEFFPCPKPIYATLTNDSLIPVPDFIQYQDQANELDTLSDRIDGLIKALKISGGYDASIPELQRIFTETDNGALIPVKNWQAFAEKNGLQGALSLVDLQPIAMALESAYRAHDQVKQQVYDVTGISDIVRGQSQASETATAQQIKGQYASLRLKQYQEQVAQFATELLQLKAQIMCRKYSPETLLKISAADQLSDADKQMIPQALALLVGEERMMNPDAENGPNPLRSFRIEVAADSLIYLDEQAEKEARVEFLTATGGFIEKMGAVLMQTPPEAKGPVVGLLMEMLKFGVTGFRVGKSIEGAFDETADKLKQLAMMPPPPPQPDPKLEAAKVKAQADMARSQSEMQVAPIKAQAEMVKAQANVIAASENARQTRLKAAMPPGMQ